MALPLIVPALGALAGATGLSAKYGLNPTKWLKNGGDLLTNTWDKFLNGNTNDVNQNIAEQNLAFQRENLEYQQALQKEIFAREDTAYSRTVNDMQAAGLNPMMMNGTNAAGEAIATQPLHNDFQYQGAGLAGVLSNVLGIMNGAQNFDIGLSYSDEMRAKAETATAEAQIAKNKATISNATTDKELESIAGKYQDDIRKWQTNADLGIAEGQPEELRQAQIALKGQQEETSARVRTLAKKAEEYYTDPDAVAKYLGKGRANRIINSITEDNPSINAIKKGYEKIEEWNQKEKPNGKIDNYFDNKTKEAFKKYKDNSIIKKLDELNYKNTGKHIWE